MDLLALRRRILWRRQLSGSSRSCSSQVTGGWLSEGLLCCSLVCSLRIDLLQLHDDLRLHKVDLLLLLTLVHQDYLLLTYGEQVEVNGVLAYIATHEVHTV